MNVNSFQQSLNQTIQGFAIYLEQFVTVGIKTAREIRHELAKATESWRSPIEFTDLQVTLLKVLLCLLLGTLLLIAYSWRVYGKVITDKFVRPSKLKTVS